MISDKRIISEKTADELSRCGKVKLNAPMSRCTTFKTGGEAGLLVEPHSEDSVVSVISILRGEGIPFHVIGGGSNLLISDNGLCGAVVRISGHDECFRITGKNIYAGAALSKEKFISEAISAGFGGVEFMAGIPGVIGGGIFMNAGTFMGSFSDILKSVKGIVKSGDLVEIDVAEGISCYRKMNLPEGIVITGGIFELPVAEEAADIRKRVEDIISDRWSKHPMEYPSAGSVFKNPEGYSSWKLINDSGLKGCRIGGAMVSEKHTNFIINTGNASSADIYNLIRHVQEVVEKNTGILLETEIRIMGNFS